MNYVFKIIIIFLTVNFILSAESKNSIEQNLLTYINYYGRDLLQEEPFSRFFGFLKKKPENFLKDFLLTIYPAQNYNDLINKLLKLPETKQKLSSSNFKQLIQEKNLESQEDIYNLFAKYFETFLYYQILTDIVSGNTKLEPTTVNRTSIIHPIFPTQKISIKRGLFELAQGIKNNLEERSDLKKAQENIKLPFELLAERAEEVEQEPALLDKQALLALKNALLDSYYFITILSSKIQELS